MSERPTKRFTTSPFSRGASEKQRRDADLFWETLFGAPDQSAQRFLDRGPFGCRKTQRQHASGA